MGLATAIVAWFGTMLFFSPRVRITDRFDGSVYQVLIRSRRWLRTMVDVEVACELHIPHADEKNILTLSTSTNSWPRVPHGWEGIVTVSMDPKSLTDFGQARLAERLSELNQPKEFGEVSSLFEVLALIPSAWIEVTVLASDGISGTRNAKHKELRPKGPG